MTSIKAIITRIYFLLPLAVPLSLTGQSTYEQRHDAFYDDISTRKINTSQRDGPHRAGRTGFWTTQGRLQRGNESSTTWSQLISTIDNADGAEDAGGANGGFSGWPGMDTYVRWNHRFPQNVKDKYFTEYTTMKTYGNGSTPNQRMMWAAACRLACETWGPSTVTQYSNASNKTGDITGKKYIETVCDRTVKYNFDERWAKHYLQFTLGPLRSIADLSSDPILANKARMTWNWGWMDIASFSFKGRWAIPAGRGGMTQDGDSSDISEHGSWLMFGGATRYDKLEYDQVLNYTQPKIGQANLVTQPPINPEMLEAATDRTIPYTRRGLARVHETQFATSYLAKDWVLYSQLEGDTTLNSDGTIKIKDLNNNGVPSNDWASERWAVLWDETSSAGLTMKPPTGYGWAQGSGLGPHEDVMQHKGTIVGIISFPSTWTWKYTRDYIPTNTTAVINDAATTGRLYLHYSKVLIAITRSDIGNFTYPPASQTYSDKRGFAVECASLSEYPQSTAAARLAAFKADIESHPVDISHVNDATPRMIYTTRDGTLCDITWGLGGKINGDPIDYEGWPLNESPWSYQSQLGNMWVFGKDRHLIWNYKKWNELEDNRSTATTTAPVIVSNNTPVDIDLSTRVADKETPSANLNYRITGTTNGTAQILADGKTARFTPSANLAGTCNLTYTAGGTFPDHRYVFNYDYETTNAGKDASTNDRDATVSVGGIASAIGNTDIAMPLAGTSNKSLRITSGPFGSAKLSRQIHPATLNLSNHKWTFATWVKRDSYADDDFLFYIGDGDGFGGSGDEFQVWLPAQSKTAAVRYFNTAGSQTVNLTTDAILNTGEWHHVAVQFDRTTNQNGTVKLFLDGKLAATSGTVTWALKQNTPVFIGGPALNTILTRNFNGWLDDTVLVRGELTNEEIDQLATASAAHLGGVKLTQTLSIATPPLAPLNLSAISANNAVSLAWTTATGASSYRIKRGTSPTGPFTTLASSITTTSYTDVTAPFGTTAYYVVTAVNTASESANSNVASAFLPASELAIWNSGIMSAWTRGTRIAFTGYNSNETLLDIPLLIRFDATNIPGFSYAQMASPTAADLRFTDASGITELSYEIEKWNPSGTSYVWVKVPSLSKGGSILAFWGNPAATSPTYITNGSTWTAGFTGVWHLSTTNITDSTSTPQNAISNAIVNTSGKVASALQHNGTSHQAIIPDATELNLSNNYELSGWFKIAATDKPAANNYRTLFTKESSSSTRNWWIYLGSDGKLTWKSSAGIDVTSPADLANDQWHLFAAIHDGTTARLYIDGVQAATCSAPANENLTTYAIRLGSENSTRWWKGTLDEFRISNVKRSATWIRAVYDNINSNSTFTRIAPVSTYSSAFAPVISTRAATSVGSTTAALNGYLAATGGTTTSVIIYHGPTDGGTVPANWAGSLNLGARSIGNINGNVSGLPTGTIRYFRAFASNASGGSWAPETISFTTDTAAPSGLVANPLSGTVSLAWNAAIGATSYNIKRSVTSGGPYTTLMTGVTSTQSMDSSITPGLTYYYVVSAVNGGGESTNSTEISIHTLPTPTGLNAIAENSQVTISWSAVSGATSYTVKRSTNDGVSFSIIQSAINATSYTDNTTANGSTYIYAVTATNSGYESAPSRTVSVMPMGSLPAPTGLVASPYNSSANLTWSTVNGATTYRVKRATVSGGPYSTLNSTLLSPNYTSSALTNGTTYYFVVTALNGNIESPTSTEVTVTPGVTPTTFTTASYGNWNTAIWSPQLPISSFDANITFNNSSAISSTHNLGFLLANKINFSSATVALDGDTIYLAGSGPGITTTANTSHSISNSVTLDDYTTFNIASNVTTLSGVLNGDGGITKSGAGTLVLNGTNTYTSNTNVTTGIINIRNNYALGRGDISVSSTASLELQDGITVTGKRVTLAGSGGSNGALRSISGTNTWAGDITAVAVSGLTRIGCDSDTLTLSGEINQDNGETDQIVFQGNGKIVATGPIDGVSRVTRSTMGTGILSLLGENTYTGQTLINGGIVEAESISSLIGDPGDEEIALDSSSLGAPDTVPNGTIAIGNGSSSGTLRFVGPTTKTDRVVNLAGSSGGAILEQNGEGKLSFLSAFTSTGAGTKTLTLTGTGEGLIAGAIVDNSSTNKTHLTKTGTGTWTLAGDNTYSGNTAVNTGALLLTGSIASGGNLTVATGATFGGVGNVTSNTSTAGNILLIPGTLNFGGNLTFVTGGRVKWNLMDNSTAVGYGSISAPAASVSTGAAVDVILNANGSLTDFSNAFWSSSHTWPVLTAASRTGSFTLGNVSTDIAGRPSSGYGAFSITQSATGASLVWSPLTAIEQWRFTYFGITTSTGNAANNADPDGDGFSNLLEFNSSTNPIQVPSPTVTIVNPIAEPITVISTADSLQLAATCVAANPTWKWTQTSGPVSAIIENSSSPVTRVTFSQPGTYTIEVEATAGIIPYAATSSAICTIIVSPPVDMILRQTDGGYQHSAACIRADNPTWNSGLRDQLLVGRSSNIFRSLIAFDLSSIPEGALVRNAALDLWTANEAGTANNSISTVELRSLATSFTEGTGISTSGTNADTTSGATWNRRSDVDSNLPWDNQGGNEGTDLLATLSVWQTGQLNTQHTFDNTPALVNAINSDINQGEVAFVLRASSAFETGSTNAFTRIHSDDSSDTGKRPSLRLGFSLNPAPTIATGSAPQALAGEIVSLNGSATNATISTWSLISGPGNVIFGNVNNATTTVVFSHAGTHLLRLTASNSSGTVSRTLLVDVTALALDPAIFSDWQEITWPGITDTQITGPAADPDGDGLSNLLEWAILLSPTAPDLFHPNFWKNGSLLECTYTRRKTAPGEALFQVEWSDTLQNDWSTAGVQSDTPISIDATSESIHCTVPIGSSKRRFIRIRIVTPQ